MTLEIKKHGLSGGHDQQEVLRKLAQTLAHKKLNDASVASLTDNSGGTAGTLSEISLGFTNVAASGSSLAGKATSEAAYTTALDALRELYTKANAAATSLGIANITYSGGGASTDGTIAAVTVSVTGAATGVVAASTNTFVEQLDTAFYNLGNLTNKLCEACGVTGVTMGYTKDTATTIAAITISGGTAADPGITKVAVDASLVIARANVATIAAALNRCTATYNIKVLAS